MWCGFLFNLILSLFSPEIDENEIDDHSDLGFVQPNEPNVKPYLFEKFRSAAINDLKLFLKLRSEELSDNGEGLFLMVGGGSLGYDMLDSKNPYGGQNVGFLDCKDGSIFKEAFENAVKDAQNENIADKLKRAHHFTFAQYFLRCESDVLESFEDVKDDLELKELKWKICPITCGTPEKLGNFIWSIHGHSLTEGIKTSINKDASIDMQEKEGVSNQIINSLKHHLYILSKKYYPDGKTHASYMYMVVKRKPRKWCKINTLFSRATEADHIS